MLTLTAAKVVVGLITLIGVALAPKVAKMIRSRGRELTAESGPGDEPGTPDRGPEGMKM